MPTARPHYPIKRARVPRSGTGQCRFNTIQAWEIRLHCAARLVRSGGSRVVFGRLPLITALRACTTNTRNPHLQLATKSCTKPWSCCSPDQAVFDVRALKLLSGVMQSAPTRVQPSAGPKAPRRTARMQLQLSLISVVAPLPPGGRTRVQWLAATQLQCDGSPPR